MPNPVTKSNLIVVIVTCEGCGGAASPIMNDSENDVYHVLAGSTGVAQASSLGVANISLSGSLTISGQIRDIVSRPYWAMSAYEVNVLFTTNLISKYSYGSGSTNGGQTNINTQSIYWINSSSIVFEGADANGFAPSCTSNSFTEIVGGFGIVNTHCYIDGYSIANSPSTFTMGSGGTDFAEVALVMPENPNPTIFVTITQIAINAPDTANFGDWAITAMLNMILGFAFLIIPFATRETNPFLYAILFFSGLTVGCIVAKAI